MQKILYTDWTPWHLSQPKRKPCTTLPLRVSCSDCRYESSEGGNDIHSCQTLYPLLTSFFSCSFHFFCRGKYTLFLFRTNKGLSPHPGEAMLGQKGLQSFFSFFFSKDLLRFLVSFPGCLLLLANPSLSTHKTTTAVIDMSFGIWSQAH